MSALFSVQGLVVGYREPLLTLSELTVGEGEIIALLGANGAGKSTLLRTLVGVQPALGGVVSAGGEPLDGLGPRERARRVAWVPQHSPRPRQTVFDAVLLGRHPLLGWRPGEADLQVVEEVLVRLELDALALRTLDCLSGGELQRVMLGRALAQGARVLLLDEPTSGLDPRQQAKVSLLLRREARERGLAVVVALHDIGLALRLADRLALLAGGAVEVTGRPTEAQLERVYGVPVEILDVRGQQIALIGAEGVR
ncbi:MAG: ABC transporter ATP-binding protein [Deltaproteobacteria bacterium]|nr:ABC transporter ATP-binding protein [Deltaproteobacteria bacterium]